MKLKIPVVSTAVALLSGFTVLSLTLLPSPAAEAWRSLLLQWAASLGGLALLLGIINLLAVHADKISEGGRGSANSIILVVSALFTFIAALLFGPAAEFASGQATQIQPANWLFQYIQFPIETSLMALLAVTLIYAAARLLRRVPTPFAAIFLITVLLILVGNSLLASEEFSLLGDLTRGIRNWIAQVPAAAGARGILMGIALGAVATGIRILIGADRPYSG